VLVIRQAAAGILHPATEPKLVCYQRCAAVLAALSIAVLIVGLLIVNFANHSYGYIVIGVALLLMIVAGAAGSIVEHESKRASLKSSPLHKE
jgi:hypothetical protein